jgi:hypothetical protein
MPQLSNSFLTQHNLTCPFDETQARRLPGSKGTSLDAYYRHQYQLACAPTTSAPAPLLSNGGAGMGGDGAGTFGVLPDVQEKPFCWICLLIAAGIIYLLVSEEK